MDDTNKSRAPDIFDRADDLRKEWRLTGTGPYATTPSPKAPDTLTIEVITDGTPLPVFAGTPRKVDLSAGPYAVPGTSAAPEITPERRAAIHAKVLSTIGDFEPMIGPAFKPELTDQQLYDIAKRHMYDIGGSKAVNYLPFARELLAPVAALVADNAALRADLSDARSNWESGAEELRQADLVREQLVGALRVMLETQPNANDGRTGGHQSVTAEDVAACRQARAALTAAGAP